MTLDHEPASGSTPAERPRTHEVKEVAWPCRPYKGLASYTVDDLLLFAGRDRELSECVQQLTRDELQIFLLHGESGSGKSSFLRAGLIPRLRVDQSLELAPFVVRSGREPLAAIAGAVYKEILRQYEKYKNQNWPHWEHLEAAKGDYEAGAEFVEKVLSDHKILVDALANLANAISERLLIVVDQAEDLFASEADGPGVRRYFRAIAALARKRLDVKIVISLRSEYKARFDDALWSVDVSPQGSSSYYLNPISEAGMKEAIMRPTSREPFLHLGKSYPPPYEQYRFSFESGLDEIIAKEVIGSVGKTMRLPLLQLTCDRLHQYAQERGAQDRDSRSAGTSLVVTMAHYRANGASSTQVAAHVEDKIVEFVRSTGSGSDLAMMADDWRRVLCEFVSDEGLHPKAKLQVPLVVIEQAAERKALTSVPEMLNWLSKEENYVLLPAEEEADKPGAWRLIHDSIAVDLAEWRREVEYRQLYLNELGHDPILQTEALKSDALYESPLHIRTLRTLNDFIWDHQIVLYAMEKGFAPRLGFDIVADSTLGDDENGTLMYKKFLEAAPDPQIGRVAVCPPVLFPKISQEPWLSLGITNVYRGFAIIGRRRADLLPLEILPKTLSSLEPLARELVKDTTRVAAFEEKSEDFIRTFLKLFTLSRDAQIEVVAPARERRSQLRDLMFSWLVDDKADFAIGPAPSRALAEQAGFVVYVDFDSLIELAERAPELAGLDVRGKLTESYMHEHWVVDLPEEDEATLLRLVSLVFYTTEFIRRNPEDFVRFIYSHVRPGAFHIRRKYIRRAVIRSYTFLPIREYGFSYLDPTSQYWSGRYRGMQFYEKWLNLRGECEKLMLEVERRLEEPCSPNDRLVWERAKNHSRIFNYYDAVQCLHALIDRR